jgi:hypothetical protein
MQHSTSTFSCLLIDILYLVFRTGRPGDLSDSPTRRCGMCGRQALLESLMNKVLRGRALGWRLIFPLVSSRALPKAGLAQLQAKSRVPQQICLQASRVRQQGRL